MNKTKLLSSRTIPTTYRWCLRIDEISEIHPSLVCRLSNYPSKRLDVEVFNTVENPIEELLHTIKQGDLQLDFVDKNGVVIQSWLYTNVKLKMEDLTLGFLDVSYNEEDENRHTFTLSFEYDKLHNIQFNSKG